jgi:elongation factor G
VIIKVADDLHLDMIGENLKRAHIFEVSVGAPKVAYPETLARPTEIDYTHRKQTGGTGQFAHVKLRPSPMIETQATNSKAWCRRGCAEGVHPWRRAGRAGGWRSGRMGFPMVDTKVTLLDGRLP